MQEQHKKQPEISIIVPVYKTERFLSACISSILAQTFTDFELILVDDGSPDSCPALCDAAAAKDSRIRVVFAKGRALDAGGAVCLPVGRAAMIFITGPLYSGKRTFAQTLPGKRLSDVQVLAADAADLPALADKLAHEYEILIATEVGGGVVPMDVKQRADREAAGRLACLLAARAECVVQMFCGIPTVLKGELSQC